MRLPVSSHHASFGVRCGLAASIFLAIRCCLYILAGGRHHAFLGFDGSMVNAYMSVCVVCVFTNNLFGGRRSTINQMIKREKSIAFSSITDFVPNISIIRTTKDNILVFIVLCVQEKNHFQRPLSDLINNNTHLWVVGRTFISVNFMCMLEWIRFGRYFYFIFLHFIDVCQQYSHITRTAYKWMIRFYSFFFLFGNSLRMVMWIFWLWSYEC